MATLISSSSALYRGPGAIMTTSGGTIYCVYPESTTYYRIYKNVDGSKSSVAYEAPFGSGEEIQGLHACIDSNDKIHVVIGCRVDDTGGNGDVIYRVLDTSDDTWDAAWEEIEDYGTLGNDPPTYMQSVYIAVESDNTVHIIFTESKNSMGTGYDQVFHAYGSAGSWSTQQVTANATYYYQRPKIYLDDNDDIHLLTVRSSGRYPTYIKCTSGSWGSESNNTHLGDTHGVIVVGTTPYFCHGSSGYDLYQGSTITSMTNIYTDGANSNPGDYVYINSAHYIFCYGDSVNRDVCIYTYNGSSWDQNVVWDTSSAWRGFAETSRYNQNQSGQINYMFDTAYNLYYDYYTISAGTDVDSSIYAYLKGGVESTSSVYAYLQGQTAATPSSVYAYLNGGVETSSSVHAYLKGKDDASSSIYAYLEGYLSNKSSKPAYLKGQDDAKSSIYAYTYGVVRSSIYAYMFGGYAASSSIHAYTEGVVRSSVHAYLSGPYTPSSSIHAYLEGAAPDVVVAVTTAKCNTSTGNQNITTTDLGGKTPKGAIVFLARADVASTNELNAAWSIGSVGSSGYGHATGGISHDNKSIDDDFAVVGSPNNDTNEYLVYLPDNSTGTLNLEAKAYHSAWITNGMTIYWSDAPDDDWYLVVIFFAGDVECYSNAMDLAQANSGDEAVDIGFEPDFIFTYGRVADQPTSGGEYYSDSWTMWDVGFAANVGGTIQQATSRREERRYQFPHYSGWIMSYIYEDSIFAPQTTYYEPGDSGYVSLEIKSFDPSGFTFGKVGTYTLYRHLPYFACRLVGKSARLNVIDSRTSTGSQTYNSFGIRPDWGIVLSTLHTNTDNLVSGNNGNQSEGCEIAWGAFEGTSNSHAIGLMTDLVQYDYDTRTRYDASGPFICYDHDESTGIIGSITAITNLGFTVNWTAVKASARKQLVLVVGDDLSAKSSVLAYTRGKDTASSSTHAYLEGTLGTAVRDDIFAYLKGQVEVTTSIPAYLSGVVRSKISAYILGLGTEIRDSAYAYLKGQSTASSSVYAYLEGSTPDVVDSIYAYLKGHNQVTDSILAYLAGWDTSSSSIYAYLSGVVESTSSISAYLSGTGDYTSSIHAYLSGVTRSSVHAYLEGQIQSVDYTVITTGDGATTGRFRILAEGYSDGTLMRGSQIIRTVGGGTDIHAAEIYQVWQPNIKVRHTEPVSGYGTLSDLETLYQYYGTVTWRNHYQQEFTVLLLGKLDKSIIGFQVEGENAWYIVQLMLVEV